MTFDPFLWPDLASLPEEPQEYELRCNGCGKSPNELTEYAMLAESEGYEARDGQTAAERACVREEGTYNRANGHFWCTSCYLTAGSPLGRAS